MRKHKSILPSFVLPALLILLMLLPTSCKKEVATEVPLTRAVKGTFYLEIYEEGEIEAINSTSLITPNISWRYGNLKITQIVKDGTEVKAGDTVVVFDPSEVNRGVIDAESRLEMNIADLERMRAQHQSDLEEMESDLEVTRLSHEISRIRFESAAYEADIRKKEIKLNLDRAGIALERAKEQIENRKRIQKEEIKQQQLSITQDEIRLAEAYETLAKLNLITESPGIAIIARNRSTNVKYQLGDQVWSGFPLIQLPDLSALRANVKINEVDISKISLGLPVEIKPDAFSDSIFHGKVTAVANLAVNKDNRSKVKVFPVEITIDGADKKLLPGLTVSCRIILGKIENALYVPLEAIITEGDLKYVYKKTASGYEKTEVETSESNKNYIIITSGLEENDQVALSDPSVKEDEKKESSTTKES